MLKFEKIECSFFSGETGLDYFKQNPTVILRIIAPLYWWVDIDWTKYYLNMPLSDFEFCLDGCDQELKTAMQDLSRNMADANRNERRIMQILPLSVMVTATIELKYQEIIEVCENYVNGEYTYIRGYGFPNEREWKDFCETLLDIKGVRDIVKEEK